MRIDSSEKDRGQFATEIELISRQPRLTGDTAVSVMGSQSRRGKLSLISTPRCRDITLTLRPLPGLTTGLFAVFFLIGSRLLESIVEHASLAQAPLSRREILVGKATASDAAAGAISV